MSANLSAVLKERMIIFNLKNYYIDSRLNFRGNDLNNQNQNKDNVFNNVWSPFNFYAVCRKNRERPQHPNFSLKTFTNVTLYIFESVPR